MHGQFPACQDRAQLISIWKESAGVENVHFHLREEKRAWKVSEAKLHASFI